MTTGTRTPWMDGGRAQNHPRFLQHGYTVENTCEGKHFNMSQFSEVDPIKILNQLRWRHYIVYWSSIYALNNTRSTQNNLAECGVCDGMSAFYALSAAKTMDKTVKAYLYDAWGRDERRLLSRVREAYCWRLFYLNMEFTKNNLSLFGTNEIIFNKGYVPDVFQAAENPDRIVWLHIDLNSSLPTLGALDYFWDKLEDGGVILFDDYAWPGWQDTQKAVEEWSTERNGTLFHLPTGQALFIKRGI